MSDAVSHVYKYIHTYNRLNMLIPSQREGGGGGRSPTRPITAVPTGVGDGAEGGVRLLGRGGATEANFFG